MRRKARNPCLIHESRAFLAVSFSRAAAPP